MRIAVVGGGIVGLATARLLAAEGHELVVLEKERALATHQTARNSGVVHAGIYYAPGSLKAKLCRRGRELLRAFCAERGLPYAEYGKVVVAVEQRELEPLRRLAERAEANDVPGLRWLDQDGIAEVEPHVRGLAALHSPRSASCDFAAVALALAGELTEAGGTVRTEARVVRVLSTGTSMRGGAGHAASPGGVTIELADGELVRADRAVVCAGLHADRLARASGQPQAPRIVPFRGEYWRLAPERAALVRGLVYPVPDPSLPFLGIHLTRRIDGEVLVGPNAVLALAREGYRRRDFSARDAVEALTWPGTLRMMRRHWRAGLDELRRSLSAHAFVAAAQRYVPELRAADVRSAPAGVRAQALERDGALVDDFRLGSSGGVVWVRNAPSPAATSALAIAEELAGLVLSSRPAAGSSPAPAAA